MLAKCYTDFTVIHTLDEGSKRGYVEKLLHIFHGVLKEKPGLFAVALPEMVVGDRRIRSLGNVVRVFAESTQDLYMLYDLIRKHFVANYVNLGLPKDVPDDFRGTWTIWRRARVQNKPGIDDTNYRLTIKRVQSSNQVMMKSKSTEQVFPFYYYRESGRPQTTEFTPNGYGLSTKENWFSLPDLP